MPRVRKKSTESAHKPEPNPSAKQNGRDSFLSRPSVNLTLNSLVERHGPHTQAVGCRVKCPGCRIDREVRHFDDRHSDTRDVPLCNPSLHPEYGEVGRDIQVSGQRILNNRGQRNVRQVEVDRSEGRADTVKGHAEDVSRLRRCNRAITGIRYPGVIRVGRINRDVCHNTTRIGSTSRRIQPGPDNAGCRIGIDVVADKHATASRSRPCSGGIDACASDCIYVATRAGRTVEASDQRSGGVTTRRTAEALEVTASRLSSGGRELWAVRFQERLVAAPILCSPHTERALEDGLRRSRAWISNDWRIEIRTLRAVLHVCTDNDPLRRTSVLEVRVVGLESERIESEISIETAES